MKTVLISATLVLAMAGVAQAHVPFAAPLKTPTQKLSAFGSISVKPLPAAKTLQGWVLHNPYKPQTIKLTFVE